MTDLFKVFIDSNSANVREFFKNAPLKLSQAAESFAKEMTALNNLRQLLRFHQNNTLIIVCFGSDVYKYMTQGVKKKQNVFINELMKALPGVQIIIGYLNHYSFLIRCGYSDEENITNYLKQFNELEHIINNNSDTIINPLILDKPSTIKRKDKTK